jgi:hypothetical protein
LRSAGLDLVADLVSPFPDIRLSRGDDSELNTLVNHDVFPVPKLDKDTVSRLLINPGYYGSWQKPE